MKVLTLWFPLIVLGSVICGCELYSFGGKMSDTDHGGLVGTGWTLEARQAVSERKRGVPEGELYTISFETDTSAVATAHCNSCGGIYETDDEKILSFRYIICTRQVCGWLGNYMAALRRTESFELEGDRLRLYYTIVSTEFVPVGRAILHFRRGIQE